MNLRLEHFLQSAGKQSLNVLAVGASLLLSGTSVDFHKRVPSIEDAPLTPSAEGQRARQVYRAEIVAEYWPGVNGDPEDIFDVEFRQLPAREQKELLARVKKYAP